MTGVLIKRGNLDTETHTVKTSHEDEGGDQDGTLSQDKEGNILSQSLQKELTLLHLPLGLLASRTARQQNFVFEATQFVEHFYRSPNKVI